MDFPAILKDAQERLGFSTQKEFAAFLGIDPSRLTRYLRGMEPRLSSLQIIADKLGYEMFTDSQDEGVSPAPAVPFHVEDEETICDQEPGQVICVDFRARLVNPKR